jgi:putative ABC transport system permease protein
MDHLLRDLRTGIRGLWASPQFTLPAILTLALGIGASTSIFSVINGTLLRPLPYSQPERIATIWSANPKLNLPFDRLGSSAPQFVDYRDQADVFERIAAFKSDAVTADGTNLEGKGEPEKLGATLVTSGFFAALGVQPVLGQTFAAEDDQPGHGQKAILSYDLWRRRFGGDPHVLNQAITLSGKSFEVAGVMPPGFSYPRGAELPAWLKFAARTDVWLPLAFTAEELNLRDGLANSVIARLRPGATMGQAQSQLSAIAARNEELHPQTDAGFQAVLTPMQDQIAGSLKPGLMIMLGAVGFVLLIACANVANLLLARGAARQREIALRAALGASRLRIVQQLLAETLALSLAGGILGLLLALLGVNLLKAAAPPNVPRLSEVTVDGRVLLFTLVVAVVTAIASGLIPALQLSRPELNYWLKEGQRSLSPGSHFLRDALVVAEVALALVLLIGAGLLIRSMAQIYGLDMGFDANKVLTMQLSIPHTRYPKPEQRLDLYNQVLQRVRALPGVTSAAGVSTIPQTGGGSVAGFRIEGHPPPASMHEMPLASFEVTTVDYLRTMGMSLLRGREFTVQDDEKAPGVVIINEALARRYFPEEDPVGKRITAFFGGVIPLTIIGLVHDVKNASLDAEAKPELFGHYLQTPQLDLAIVLRIASESQTLAAAARNEIRSVDPEIPVHSVATMDEVVARPLSGRRFNLQLLSLFAAIGLLLAAIGIYGLMSYRVTQRTHELGIRMALGADRARLLWSVVGRGIALTLLGLGAGLIATFALTRLMAGMLFGISATDPLTLAAISLLLAGVGVVSNLIPARRATLLDPLAALRQE